MPKVSVIIPVYGVEKYIERCARSLFEQTLDDIEYLFIDDCTPDHSIDILKQVLESYPQRKNQVVIHRMEMNSGQAAVRKWGMLNVTGDYIIHCDSDDWVDRDMYRAMYEKALGTDADMVVCDYVVTDGTTYEKIVEACHSTIIEQFLENCLFQRDPWSLCNKLFKKTAYYNVEFPQGAMGEDMATTLQLMWNCKRMEYIPVSYYYYFFNPLSITKKRTKEDCLRNFCQVKENAEIVFRAFAQKTLTPTMKDGLVYLKFHVKSILLPLVWKKEYYVLWKNLYDNFNCEFFQMKSVGIMIKFKYLLTILRFYPRKKDRIIF